MTMKIQNSEIDRIETSYRQESFDWLADDDNFYSVPRKIRIAQYEGETYNGKPWHIEDGRHRIIASQERGFWWIEADYTKYDQEGYIIEQGTCMVIL